VFFARSSQTESLEQAMLLTGVIIGDGFILLVRVYEQFALLHNLSGIRKYER